MVSRSCRPLWTFPRCASTSLSVSSRVTNATTRYCWRPDRHPSAESLFKLAVLRPSVSNYLCPFWRRGDALSPCPSRITVAHLSRCVIQHKEDLRAMLTSISQQESPSFMDQHLPFPRLPLELCLLILDSLGDGMNQFHPDQETRDALQQCTLVCSEWRERAREFT